jgi:hypothetical protein
MFQKLLEGLKGYGVWKNITKKYNVMNDNFFIIYPGEDELVDFICKYLYVYMTECNAIRCIFITENKNNAVKIDRAFAGNNNISTVVVGMRNIKLLMSAYWYGMTSNKTMIVSIKNLYGRNIYNLVGKKNISKEDLMIAALFNLNAKKERINADEIKWTFRV